MLGGFWMAYINGNKIAFGVNASYMNGYTDEDLEAARQEGYQQGVAAGGASVDIPPGVIRFWQPNTEYKVGECCLTAAVNNFYILNYKCTQIFECIKSHCSGEKFLDENNAYDTSLWKVKHIISADESALSRKTIYDGNGNQIDTTYATKEEVTQAIGQALEGDY